MILQNNTHLLDNTQIFTDILNLRKTNDVNASKGTYTGESEFPSDQSNENASHKSNLKRKRKQNQSLSSSITAHRPSELFGAKRTRVLRNNCKD